MSKIYFSLEEANEMIQKIKPKLNEISLLREELDLLDNTKIEFEDEKVENYLLEVELNKNFHEKNLRLYEIIGELIKTSCIVRDINNLEIDFYSRLDNKDITFCWNPGQEKIVYWHYPHEERKRKRPIREIETYYFETLKKLR
jgi:hypothetical protein